MPLPSPSFLSPAVFAGSVMARNTSTFVLLNLFESLPCTRSSDPSCPSDNQYIYVTDVLFDEEGTLVARYRKSHPFYIFSVNKPPQAELVFYTPPSAARFDGVTFGLFICADIAFSDPAVELITAGVKHFLYAAAIGSVGKDTIAPAWSLMHHATLLLANNGANCSAAFVQGKSQPTMRIEVPQSQDSLLIVDINSPQ